MAVSDADIAFVQDLFAPLGDITTRKMMGGLSIYCRGRIFAMLSGAGRLYLKSKGDFDREMAAAGGELFTYDGGSMAYRSLPEAALEDAETACDWARRGGFV